jgi:hypothetical protein
VLSARTIKWGQTFSRLQRPPKWYDYHMSDRAPFTYSQLRELLMARKMTVSALHRAMREKCGVKVNVKSLYRLASNKPLQKIDGRIIGAICRTINSPIEALLSLEKPAQHLHRLTPAEQNRLDALMEQNTEGELTRRESTEFEGLVDKAHRLSVENARILAQQARGSSAKSTGGKKRRKGRGRVAASA